MRVIRLLDGGFRPGLSPLGARREGWLVPKAGKVLAVGAKPQMRVWLSSLIVQSSWRGGTPCSRDHPDTLATHRADDALRGLTPLPIS